MSDGGQGAGDALLEARGLTKTFPGVKALDGVDFTVRRGEVHALMGENGAGKSTLIKAITGVDPPDAGGVTLDGQPIAPTAPLEAERAGIATVYQEVNLVPDLSVAENIMLGRQPKRHGFLRWGEIRARAGEALARLGLDVDPDRPVSDYSIAVQQLVAIARALHVDAKLLILDEPTSSLDEREVAELFGVMRALREEGLGIIFVTHFLDQVYAVSDRITVLRNGTLVGEYPIAELPRLELISRMLGKEAEEVAPVGDTMAMGGDEVEDGELLLEARGLQRGGLGPVDLTLRRGEILGLAGLLGSGRTETARLLFGADRITGGTLEIKGSLERLPSPAGAIAAGVGFCSEDRKAEGIVPSLSVRENMLLAMQAREGALHKIPAARQRELAEHYIEALGIKTPSPETPIENLSGGNQQKVLLARWLCMQPEIIILDEPTRGIDVGAKVEIEHLVASLRADGMAVVFISSELDEVARACSRVAVMRDLKKVGELAGDEIDETAIMKMVAAHD